MSAAATQNPPPPPFPHAPQDDAQSSQTAAQSSQQPANAASDAPPTSSQPVSSPVATFMRLRAEIPQMPVPIRNTRKRKSPPSAADTAQQDVAQAQAQAQAAQAHPQHPSQQQMPPHVYPGLPPPAGNVYPPPMQYAYAHPPPGQDYTAGGMMPPGAPQMMQAPPPPQQEQADMATLQSRTGPNRQLSTSKRAEQNRKAQRAFRERRDQHVKALESRSQLLDAALASADEANRRWEECRALVDQLRIENTALRTALQQSQAQLASANPSVVGGHTGEGKPEGMNGERADDREATAS